MLQDYIALRIGCHEHHSVGMTWKRWAVVEHDITGRIQPQAGQAFGAHGLLNLPGLQSRFAFGCIKCGRQKTCKTQQGGAVGGMANAGKGQRPMEPGLHACGLKGAGSQEVQKHPRRNHWAHSMRRTWPDAHFEHIEYRQKHERLAGLNILR